MEKNVKIIIATHKKYKMPNDEMYIPLHVGKEGKQNIGYIGDDTGENISTKNPNYCELTGLYWAWKNLDAEYIGLAHYRRHFSLKRKSKDKYKNVLTSEEVSELLDDIDIIAAKKRNYIIENLYDHYKHTMFVEPLDIAGNIIEEKYPKYKYEFDRLKKRKKAHMFNMFIMKKDKFDEYCSWLFPILFELEKRIDSSIYDSFHARFYGRISELLFDVWLYTNKYKCKDVNFIYMEKINWSAKIIGFLKAKFKGEKYGKSF